MTFFDRLERETTNERERLYRIPLIRQALEGKVSRDDYVAFLNEAYHHVRHTVPLLMACGARLPARLEWLREAMGEYIQEEMGHQEWILRDIGASGGDGEAARNGQPALATEVMISYAWDTIQRGNPVGFLGMVYVLEGTSTALATRAAEVMQQSLGLPREAFTYLFSHGALDLEHVEFFRSLADRLVLEQDRQRVIHCARVFFHLYGEIFRTLERADNRAAA